jgi:hypothetical protein
MKRACVASQNWQWREARCSQYSLYWQAERQSQCRFWPQPLGAGAVLARGITIGVIRVAGNGPGHIPRAAKTVTAQRVFHFVTGSYAKPPEDIE